MRVINLQSTTARLTSLVTRVHPVISVTVPSWTAAIAAFLITGSWLWLIGVNLGLTAFLLWVHYNNEMRNQ